MTADDFARGLAELGPGVDELREHGLDDDEIEGIRAHFLCVPLVGEPRHANPLVDLMTRFECAEVRIGSFAFASNAVVASADTAGRVGSFELDEVMLDAGGRVMIQRVDSSRVDMAAHGGEEFLSALLVAARLILRREAIRGRTLQSLRSEVASAAGGADCMPLAAELILPE